MIFSWIDFNEKYFNYYNISFIISMVSYSIDLFPFNTWSSHSPCKIKTTWNKFKCVLIYILLLSYRHVEILKRLTSFEKGHIIQLNSNGRSTNIIIHKLWRSFFWQLSPFIAWICADGYFACIKSVGRKGKTTPRDVILIIHQVETCCRVSCPSILAQLSF